MRSIFNLSKSILKSREAFPILDEGIRKNLREGILKSEKAFSTLDEKNETFQFKRVSFRIFTKSFLIWTRKGVPEKRHYKYTLTAF